MGYWLPGIGEFSVSIIANLLSDYIYDKLKKKKTFKLNDIQELMKEAFDSLIIQIDESLDKRFLLSREIMVQRFKQEVVPEIITHVKKSNENMESAINQAIEEVAKNFYSEIGAHVQDLKLLNKESYNERVIKVLKDSPKLIRAIVMGPYFLHPQWLVNRRLEREPRKSFSLALQNYLKASIYHPERSIRLIIRNSPRYLKYLKQYINSHEISILIREMIDTLHTLFPTSSLNSSIFCCVDTGYYHGVIITKMSYFKYFRKSMDTPIEGGYESNNPSEIENELNIFDKVFNENYKGRNKEIAHLKKYIKSLEQHFNKTLY